MFREEQLREDINALLVLMRPCVAEDFYALLARRLWGKDRLVDAMMRALDYGYIEFAEGKDEYPPLWRLGVDRVRLTDVGERRGREWRPGMPIDSYPRHRARAASRYGRH